MKKIIAACYDRYLEFDTEDELQRYLGKLNENKSSYHILENNVVNGKFRLRIQERYNRNPMYQEIEEGPDPKAVFFEMLNCLPDTQEDPSGICSVDGEEILFKSQKDCYAVGRFLEAMGVEVTCGHYDPEEDRRNDEVDSLTGWYYIH